MTCNCDNDGSNEYIIELGEFGLPGAKGDRGKQGYSPVVSYTTNSDTIQFTLVNENSTLTTPNYYDYLAKRDLSNSSIYTILSDYPTNSQVANTYLSKSDAVATYLKVDGSNANNPITINNLPIEKSGTGAKLGNTSIDRLNLQAKTINLVKVDSNGDQQSMIQMASGGNLYIYAGGSLQFKGSGARPSYTQNGGTAKSLALLTDIPDVTTKLNTDGSNATSNIAINGITFKNQGDYNNIIKAKDGLNLELSNGGSILDNTRATIYLDTTGNAQISGDNNVNLSAVNDIHLNTTNGKVYYGATTDASKEVATVGDINDATITITQGGVTKGAFTLNQSSNATIALDAGGSASTNPIVLKTTDESRSLTLGLNNDTKKAYMTYTISSGGIDLPLSVRLIAGKSAPITLTETNEGLTTIGLDYDTNTLGLDANNKLTANIPDVSNLANKDLDNLSTDGEERLHALKGYSDEGEVLTDPEGLRDVEYYNHSSFDSSKFTIVGSPTITDGIASGFSTSNFIVTPNIDWANANSWELIIPYKFTAIGTREAIIGDVTESTGIRLAKTTNELLAIYFGNNGSWIWYNGGITGLTLSTNTQYFIKIAFTGTAYTLAISTDLGKTYTQYLNQPSTTKMSSTTQCIGIQKGTTYPATNSIIDLKYYSVTINGQETFSGNKTGVDTYTIGSDTITIPYKVSKTGSKIVDSSRRPEVEAVYEDQGYALYYTLDETNGNFTLPMGEIYGYITRLEGIVKDLQTRLTALETNINAGGAGVVQQGLLGMSPLSLNRPQLQLNEFEPIQFEDGLEPINEDLCEETTEEEPIEETIEEQEQPQEEEGGQDE